MIMSMIRANWLGLLIDFWIFKELSSVSQKLLSYLEDFVSVLKIGAIREIKFHDVEDCVIKMCWIFSDYF